MLFLVVAIIFNCNNNIFHMYILIIRGSERELYELEMRIYIYPTGKLTHDIDRKFTESLVFVVVLPVPSYVFFSSGFGCVQSILFFVFLLLFSFVPSCCVFWSFLMGGRF